MAAAGLSHMHSTVHHGDSNLEAEARQGYHCGDVLARRDLRLCQSTVRLVEPQTSCVHQQLTMFRSVVPFWISVAIGQEREVAVLGCQVVQLVLFNWPPVFTPPVLAQIKMGPAEDREEFWGRVHWPWQSNSCKTEGEEDDDDDDEVRLTDSPSRDTSLASTAQSSWEEVILPKAVHALDQAASPSAADARLILANCRSGVLRLLC